MSHRLTVVVITFARQQLLRRCLESVRTAEDYSGRRMKVVVGVNDSEEIIEGLNGVQVVPLGRRFSPAEARNRLLPQVDTEWVYFLDDDAFVPKDIFEKFESVLERRPDAQAIGGPNLTPPAASRFQQAAGLALGSRFAAYLSAARYRGTGPLRSTTERDLILCNLFVQARILGETPFPHHLVCAEENWFLEEARRKGAVLVYDPVLFVWHERRADVRSFARQVFKYGQGRGQCLREDPRSLKWPHILPSLALLYAAAAPAVSLIPFVIYPFFCVVAGLTAGVKARAGIGLTLLSVPLFPLIHVCYGAGVLFGLNQIIEGRRNHDSDSRKYGHRRETPVLERDFSLGSHQQNNGPDASL